MISLLALLAEDPERDVRGSRLSATCVGAEIGRIFAGGLREGSRVGGTVEDDAPAFHQRHHVRRINFGAHRQVPLEAQGQDPAASAESSPSDLTITL